MDARARSRLTPWTDRAGRFSPLKAMTFAALFAPAAATAHLLFSGGYAAEPSKGVNHELGLWAFRLLLLSLTVTPAMQIFRYTRLILVRRMIGVAAFAYAFAHFLAYIVMENYDLAKVASEIVLRIYLTIGFAVLLILGVLAATSFDSAVRRLGTRGWTWLHRSVYLAATLGVIHYTLQVKLVVLEPSIFAGLFSWLMGYRVILWSTRPRVAMRPSVLLALGIAATVLTALGEAAGYSLFTPIDGTKVLMANFNFGPLIRPAWVVAAFGLTVPLLALIRGAFVPKRV